MCALGAFPALAAVCVTPAGRLVVYLRHWQETQRAHGTFYQDVGLLLLPTPAVSQRSLTVHASADRWWCVGV